MNDDHQQARAMTAEEQAHVDSLAQKLEELQAQHEERRNRHDREHIMQFFAYEHLPPHLQAVSEPFGALAESLLVLPRNPERTAALRKLLESKDAAVRALVAKEG